MPRAWWLLLVIAAMPCALDVASRWRVVPPLTQAQTLFFELHDAPFPGSGRPDVGVHVPPGFDAGRRPALVLYFHGWNGCVQAALSDDDQPCVEDGPTRAASHLASQLDESGTNALLVAVELRVDTPSGETGGLATPGVLRSMLRELFEERLREALGLVLDVDALGSVMVVAHSGGYQAAASALRFGEVRHVTEIVLLDALYGADDVFLQAIDASKLRLVNIYTYGGGTLERSRDLCRHASESDAAAVRERQQGRTDDADAPGDPDTALLSRRVACRLVARPHGELPAAYMRAILESASPDSLPRTQGMQGAQGAQGR